MTIHLAPRAISRTAALAALVALVATSVPAHADETPAADPETTVVSGSADPTDSTSDAGETPTEALDSTSTAAPAPTAAAAPEPGSPCFPGACIDNGTVLLGVNPTGALNVGNGAGSASGDRNDVGLQFLPTGNDGVVPGSPYEGWGVADPGSGVSGGAVGGSGNNITVDSFDATSTTATSVVTVGDVDDPTFRVTHSFYPSPSTPNLFVVKVTIQNLTDGTIDRVLYRRMVDWDIEPTEFEELVTIAKGDAAAIVGATDDGFSDPNPLLAPSGVEGNAEDLGPEDRGTTFDLAFGPLSSNGIIEFFLYFGAAATEDEAKAALGEVGAEAYSFGQTSDGGVTGAPNTFILGFSGIGGTPIFADPTPDPDPVPGPGPVVDPVDADSDVVPAAASVTASAPAASVGAAQLPATGASLGRDVAPVGVLMLLGGVVLLAVSRRRGVLTR